MWVCATTRLRSLPRLAVLVAFAIVVLGGCWTIPELPIADHYTPPPPAIDFTGDYGAVAPGTASYPVPAGAIVVSPAGDDANAGTIAAPLRTLKRAVAIATNGKTIVVRAGDYHESVEVADKRVTIQNYPGELARMNGSVRTLGWVSAGDDWRLDGWTAQFERSTGSHLIDPATNPAAGFPDQVFIDGNPLWQVNARTKVVPGTFFVNYSTDEIFIGDNPIGHNVEASDLPYGLTLRRAHGSVVRGLVFRRYATPVPDHGAVRGYSDDLLFENNHFSQNASAGLGIVGDRVRVFHNTASDNGKLGLQVDTSLDTQVEGNHLIRNNAELFLIESSEGGAKFTTSRRATFRRNLSEYNYGRGVWFDVASWDFGILQNVVRHNESNGIQVEISGNAVVAGNWVYGNAWGVYVLESNSVNIWNNTLVENTRNVFVLEGRRSSGDPQIPQKVSAITIRNNILWRGDTQTVSLLGVQDANKKLTAEQMGVSTNYNAYHRPNSSDPKWVVTWANYPDDQHLLTSVGAVRSTTGQEMKGIELTTGSDPLFVDAANGDYHLRANSPAAGKGVALPASIASALGVTAGVAVDMGALGI
jgi:hypothetical protein